MAMNGSDVLLYAEDAPGSGNLIVIGSQRDVSFDEQSGTVDYSSKDSRAQKVGYGRYSSSAQLSALYVPSDTAMLALKKAIRDGLYIKVQKIESGVAFEEAEAVVTGNSTAFPDQGEATVSVNLTINGEWEAV